MMFPIPAFISIDGGGLFLIALVFGLIVLAYAAVAIAALWAFWRGYIPMGVICAACFLAVGLGPNLYDRVMVTRAVAQANAISYWPEDLSAKGKSFAFAYTDYGFCPNACEGLLEFGAPSHVYGMSNTALKEGTPVDLTTLIDSETTLESLKNTDYTAARFIPLTAPPEAIDYLLVRTSGGAEWMRDLLEHHGHSLDRRTADRVLLIFAPTNMRSFDIRSEKPLAVMILPKVLIPGRFFYFETAMQLPHYRTYNDMLAAWLCPEDTGQTQCRYIF
ncbi:hypothetical protein IV417_04260 [Alphaproteobacteria bacterium KMM 3653]|uniref:Uncharacterized protein n=1 Tax=Harenicola maris TaxID=2841044 RepID=A0AAP2CMJ7_9RHOB|nr:hypothetical protein [Harenicola maris]